LAPCIRLYRTYRLLSVDDSPQLAEREARAPEATREGFLLESPIYRRVAKASSLELAMAAPDEIIDCLFGESPEIIDKEAELGLSEPILGFQIAPALGS